MNKPIFRLCLLLTFICAAMPLCAFFQIQGSNDGTLAGTYGNKVVRDNYNKLHFAYATINGGLKFQNMDTDGTGLTPFGTFPAFNISNFNFVNPALDVDHWNNAGIAVISHNGSGTTGDLYYLHANLSTSQFWLMELIAQNASQPSIAIRKGIAHVTWINDRTVKYMAFPAGNPPYLGNGNEETVTQTTCNYSGFAKPSISLIHDNCEPDTPVIGFHYFSDEIVQQGLQCAYMSTRVGPQVMLFDNATQSWTQIYSDVRAYPGPQNLPRYETTSLSLNACFKSGSIYLAYSDILDGDGRTKVAIGNRTTWNDTVHSASQAMKIDIDANSHYNGGEFRIACDNGSSRYYRTGQWEPTQSAPTWIESVNQQVGGNNSRAPQAIFTEFCKDNSNQTSIHTFFETHFFNQQAIDFDNLFNQCNNVDYDVGPPCPSYRIYVDQNDHSISVSLAEGGSIFEAPTDNSLTYMSGEDRFVIRWHKGDIESYWTTGFKLRGGSEFFVEPPPGREAPEIVYLR